MFLNARGSAGKIGTSNGQAPPATPLEIVGYWSFNASLNLVTLTGPAVRAAGHGIAVNFDLGNSKSFMKGESSKPLKDWLAGSRDVLFPFQLVTGGPDLAPGLTALALIPDGFDAMSDLLSGYIGKSDTANTQIATKDDTPSHDALTTQILGALPDPVFIYEFGKGWTYCNLVAANMLSEAPRQTDDALELKMPKGFKRMMLHMHERVSSSGRVARIEFYAKHREQGLRWWSGLWAPLRSDNGELWAIFVLHRDITEQTELQGQLLRDRKKLNFLATTDPLTKLSNRRSFMENFADAIKSETVKGGELVILLFDIDHFKAVNDNYGHAVGDAVLMEVAAICRNSLRPHDLLARWGGEEFIVCLPGTEIGNGAMIADRVRTNIAETPISSDTATLTVTASFGVATANAASLADRAAQDALIKLADDRLYVAKRQGRNRVVSNS